MKNTLFIIIILLLSRCNNIAYYDDKISMEILNEMQGCEEDNMNYTILFVKNEKYKFLENDITLPILTKNLNTSENLNLFFPAEPKHRIKITVEGFYSRLQHNDISARCLDAHTFKVTKIVNIEIVDDLYDYPIDNK